MDTEKLYKIISENPDTSKILIRQFKEYINLQTANEKQTLLMLAVRDSNPRLVDELISEGADLNIQDIRGKTALMHSLFHANLCRCFDIIMKHNPNIHLRNSAGSDALSIAVSNPPDYVFAIALINAGASWTTKSNNQPTTFDMINDWGNQERRKEVLKLIESKKELTALPTKPVVTEPKPETTEPKPETTKPKPETSTTFQVSNAPIEKITYEMTNLSLEMISHYTSDLIKKNVSFTFKNGTITL